MSAISDPTLKQARAEIEAIIDRYDLAAVVVLHRPGHGECVLRLTPSYSRLSGGPTEYRIRSKLADYGGDQAAQRHDLEATANMLSLLSSITAETAIPLLELSAIVDAKVGAEHGTPQHQPDPPKGAH